MPPRDTELNRDVILRGRGRPDYNVR